MRNGSILLHVQQSPKNRRNLNKETGDLGERIVAQFFKNKGFQIVERNYLKKYGEIDLVARGTDQKVHFIEVKTVSYETKADLEYAVTHETWRPEEKVDGWKLHKIGLAVETWLSEHPDVKNWQIDIAAVRIVPREKTARVKIIGNIII